MDLKTFKTIKTTVLSLAVLVYGAFLVTSGADPTLMGVLGLSVAALIAGVEFSELVAVVAEVQAESGDTDDNSE